MLVLARLDECEYGRRRRIQTSGINGGSGDKALFVGRLALPSEVHEANNVNGLRKGLGKKRVIEVQAVSDRPPKPIL